MKTALDLPDELMREVKIHAVVHGRKLKDDIAELLRRGLDAEGPQSFAKLGVDPETGLPVVECLRQGSGRLSPDLVAEILLEQEVGWNRDAGR